MDPTSVVSAVSAALTSTVKLTEKVFEIRAVDEQARSLLETIDQVNGQLDVARELRRQRSGVFGAIEKKMMDDTFRSTERALRQVAKLVEPCRVSMETSQTGVGLGTRLMFVLRDSPNIQVSLTRLALTSQSLHTSLVLLYSRDVLLQDAPAASASSIMDSKRLPSYAESQFLVSSRMRNMLRRANSNIALDDSHRHGSTPPHKLLSGVPKASQDVDEQSWLPPPGNCEPSHSKHELCLDTSEHSTRAWSRSKSSGRFLPYRPGISNASTSSIHTSMPLPDSLHPGKSMSPPFAGIELDSHFSRSNHNDNRRERYNSATEEESSTARKSVRSAPSSNAWSGSDSTPNLTSVSDISHPHDKLLAELEDTSWHHHIAELEDTEIATLKSTLPPPPIRLSGRARSQRWREAQFEKFEQLQDKHGAGD